MWRKNFRNRKLQTVIMFVIIMLCALILCASASILTSLDKPFHDLADECDAADALVYPFYTRDEDIMNLAEEFQKLEQVETAECFNTHYLNEGMYFEGNKLDVFSNLTEYNEKIFSGVRYIEGNADITSNLTDDQCVIPACISAEYGMNVGDDIKIETSKGELTYTVKGIFAEPYSTSTAYDCYIIVNKIPDYLTGQLQIRLYTHEGYCGTDIEEAYRETYGGQMQCMINTLDDSIENTLLAAKILGAILIALGAIMLVVSGLIINFMVRNTMISDAKNIAIYKTIGYTIGDILNMYMIFYFVVVSFACIAGIACSGYFSKDVLQSMYQNIGMTATANVWDIGIVCYAGIVIFVLGIIVLIIRNAKNVKPVYALNGMSPTNTKKHRYKGDSKITFSSFGIAMRMLIRDKKGAAGILITAIVSIIGINFAIISIDVANGMKDNNDYWLGIDKSDAMITAADGIDAADISKMIETDDRIEKILLCNFDNKFMLDWKKGMTVTTMSAFTYDNFDDTGLEVIEGYNPHNGKEIAISGLISEQTGKGIGDYIEVTIGDKKESLLVTGLYQTYYQMGRNCRVTAEAYTDHDVEFTYDMVSIYLKDGTNIEQFIRDEEDVVGGKGKFSERTELFSSIMNMITAPQQQALPPIAVLALMIGGVNIFCIVLLKNANNENVNGIYKCIGYSTKHLIMANVWYVLLIAVLSVVISVPTVILMYPTVMKACLSMFGLLEYRISYHVTHLVITNLVILATFVLSTVISSYALRKVNVRDLVQE